MLYYAGIANTILRKNVYFLLPMSYSLVTKLKKRLLLILYRAIVY